MELYRHFARRVCTFLPLSGWGCCNTSEIQTDHYVDLIVCFSSCLRKKHDRLDLDESRCAGHFGIRIWGFGLGPTRSVESWNWDVMCVVSLSICGWLMMKAMIYPSNLTCRVDFSWCFNDIYQRRTYVLHVFHLCCLPLSALRRSIPPRGTNTQTHLLLP